MEIFGFPAGPLQTNCYVATGYAAQDGIAQPCVIIDPGMGAFEVLKRECETRNWQPEAIVLTHGHIDHIRDVAEAAEHWEIPVFIHEDDALMVRNPAFAAGSQFAQMFRVQEMQAPKQVDTFLDGEEIKWGGLSLQVLHAPGHSPGCVMLRTSDGADEVVFSGDVLFAGAIGRTDLPGGDPAAMEKSLAEKVMPLDDELLILPGHGGASTIGDEKRHNPYLQHLK